MKLSVLALLSLIVSWVSSAPPPTPAGAIKLPNQAFTVPTGSHDSAPGGVAAMRVQTILDREMGFQGYFHADAAYLTVDPINQLDWNKLMGLTSIDIHGDSLRLGWRYVPTTAEIEVGLYAYVGGLRVDQAITSVPLDTWFEVSMAWTEDELSVTVDGLEAQIPGPQAYIPRISWVLMTTYFGGDEMAPHDIHVNVRAVWTDS